MSSPRQRDLWALRRVCRFLRGAPRVVYEFPWQAAGGTLQVYADTDFAGCLETRRSTSGGCALVGQHLVKHWSVTQKCVTLSSGEAELGGLVKASGEGLGLVSLGRDLDLPFELQVFADSSAAIGICRRSGIGRVRHLAVGQLWVQQCLREGTFTLFKVLGSANPADLFTKHLARAAIQQHWQVLGVGLEDGRARSAPSVSAEIEAWLGPPPSTAFGP